METDWWADETESWKAIVVEHLSVPSRYRSSIHPFMSIHPPTYPPTKPYTHQTVHPLQLQDLDSLHPSPMTPRLAAAAALETVQSLDVCWWNHSYSTADLCTGYSVNNSLASPSPHFPTLTPRFNYSFQPLLPIVLGLRRPTLDQLLMLMRMMLMPQQKTLGHIQTITKTTARASTRQLPW